MSKQTVFYSQTNQQTSPFAQGSVFYNIITIKKCAIFTS